MKCKKVYIEPFVGGGSIITELLKQCYLNKLKDITFICSDINTILFDMYNMIKNTPHELINKLDHYVNKNNEQDY